MKIFSLCKKILTLSIVSLAIMSFYVENVEAGAVKHTIYTVDTDTGKYSFKISEEGNLFEGTDLITRMGPIQMHNTRLFGGISPFTTTSTGTIMDFYTNYSEILNNTKHGSTPNQNDMSRYWDPETVNNDIRPLSYPPGKVMNNSCQDEDLNKATQISEHLTTSLNNCINFIRQKMGQSYNGNILESFVIAEGLANSTDEGVLTREFSLGEYTIKTTHVLASETDAQFVSNYKPNLYMHEDYMRVEVYKNGTSQGHDFFPVSMYKGYREPSGTYGSHMPQLDAKDIEKSSDEYKITWRHIVTAAHVNYVVFGVDSTNAEELVDATEDYIAKWVISLLESMADGLKSLLDIQPPTDVIYGINREYTYYNNTMPKEWFTAATYLFTFCMTVAWVLLFSSIIQVSLRSNLQAMKSTLVMMDIMEGYRNIIITGLALFCIIPFFYLVTMLSVNVNDVLRSLSRCSLNFGKVKSVSTGTFGYVFLLFFNLFFDTYINVIYIYRALILAILFGISPICLVTLALPVRDSSQILRNWLHSFLSAVCLSNIHALIIAIVAPIFCTQAATMEVIGICLAFVPITKGLAKIFGLDGFDGHSVGALAGAATGAIAGSVISKRNGGVSASDYADKQTKDNTDIVDKNNESRSNINKSSGKEIEINANNDGSTNEQRDTTRNPTGSEIAIGNASFNGGNETFNDQSQNSSNTPVVSTKRDKDTGKNVATNGQKQTINTKAPEKISNENKGNVEKQKTSTSKANNDNKRQYIGIPKQAAKTALAYALGAAQVAVGATANLAGSSFGADKVGNKLIERGTGNIKDGTSALYIEGKHKYDDYKNSRKLDKKNFENIQPIEVKKNYVDLKNEQNSTIGGNETGKKNTKVTNPDGDGKVI